MEKDIGKIKKSETTDIIVRIDDYKGKKGLTIREYVTSEKYTGFSKSGTRIPADEFLNFRDIINSINLDEMTASTSAEEEVKEEKKEEKEKEVSNKADKKEKKPKGKVKKEKKGKLKPEETEGVLGEEAKIEEEAEVKEENEEDKESEEEAEEEE